MVPSSLYGFLDSSKINALLYQRFTRYASSATLYIHVLLDQIPVYWLPLHGYSTIGFSKLDLLMCKPFHVRIKTYIASLSLLPPSHSFKKLLDQICIYCKCFNDYATTT